MNHYTPAYKESWTGRKSEHKLYLHEKIECINLLNAQHLTKTGKSFGLLGYACDVGVKRNQGRVGARKGPEEIRKVLGKLPNHLLDATSVLDCGTVNCIGSSMENAQHELKACVIQLLKNNTFPIILGGGHDIAYGHFKGLKAYLGNTPSIGIINFDAHFDLRSNENGNNSGTPFYQIAADCKTEGTDFNYLCLGIRQDANDSTLFKTANQLGAHYIKNDEFTIQNIDTVLQKLAHFMGSVDYLYVTIDLDGFSSAFAPGVSAPSPMGFSPEIVLKALEAIINSKKLISIDFAELNPNYDIDNCTSKLAASLVHFLLHKITLS